MKTATLLTLVLSLAGCSLASAPCADAGIADASPSGGSRISGLGACAITGDRYGEMEREGLVSYESCPPIACPFPYDNTGRTLIECDAADVEACYWALSRANDCEAYRAAIAACDAESCR